MNVRRLFSVRDIFTGFNLCGIDAISLCLEVMVRKKVD
jgi:hypothetical protein